MQLKRIGKTLLAATISISGITALTHWYRLVSEDTSKNETHDRPVGYLKSGSEGIERRPGARLVWRALVGSEQVFTGDAIRTSSKAEGSVFLEESKMTIMLEPDSLIVLEQNKDTFSVGLIEGGLAVKQEIVPDQPGDKKTAGAKKNPDDVKLAAAPVITAAGTTLALGEKSTELNLSINKKNEVALSVTKGDIDVVKDDKKIAVKEGSVGEIKKGEMVKADVIAVKEPKPGSLIDIGAKGEKAVIFSWQPLNKKFPVRLKVGESRTALKELAVTPDDKALMLSVPLAVGTFFWQLVSIDPATKAETAQSPVYRNQTVTLSAPELIVPANNSKYFIGKEAIDVAFSWSLPPFVDKVALFVARDSGFKDIVLSKWVAGLTAYNLPMDRPGTYYVKAVGAPEGFDRKLASATYAFTIAKLRDIAAPRLTAPAEGVALPLVTVQASGLFLEWEAVDGAAKYLVSLLKDGQPLQEKPHETAETEFRIKQPGAGKYAFKVQAVGVQAQSSPWSSLRGFTLIELTLVNWKTAFDKYEYETEGASLPLAWEDGGIKAKSWRLTYACIHDDGTQGTKAQKEILGTSINLELAEDGVYEVVAQALDGKKQVIGGTKRRKIEVLPIAELPPPTLKIKEDAKGEMFAGNDGSITLGWEEVKGVSEYLIRLERLDKKKVFTYHTAKTQIKIKDLLPGRHKLYISSVNKRKKLSATSAQKIITVPDDSNISAPVLGKINIR